MNKPNWPDLTKASRIDIITQAIADRLVAREIADLFTNVTPNAVRSFCADLGIKMVPRLVASAAARRKPTRSSSAVIRQFFYIVDGSETRYKQVAARAGLHPVTLSAWRHSNSPRLIDFENAAQSVGYRLTLVPIAEAAE